MQTISAVTPVYNGAQCLKALLARLTCALAANTDTYEIILVEDCGQDNSWQLIETFSAADSHIRGIRLSRNFGQHNAILCGIRAAKFEITVTLDDDLQNPPEEIPVLLCELSRGFDVVYGTPQREQHGLLRNFASVLTKVALQNGMGIETARKVSAFRAFRTRLRDGFKNYQGPFVSVDVLLTWSTSQFTAVAVKHSPREVGKSNYTLTKLFNHTFNMLTGFSTVPLQIASMLGFVFTAFGLGVLAWVLGRYFIEGGSMPGFPFLASIIAIFSGVQLFTLGVFGEYLARIHFRTMDRPPFVVAQTTNQVSIEPDHGIEQEDARGSGTET